MPTIDGERCNLSLVKNLHVIYDSDFVTVEQGDVVTRRNTWYAGAYRVKIKPHLQLVGGKYVTGKSRVFYGESAWNQAERMASDVDFNAWGCTHV